MFKYESFHEIISSAIDKNKKICDLVIEEQIISQQISEEDLISEMSYRLQVMKEAAESGLKNKKKSSSGLSGGDANKLKQEIDKENFQLLDKFILDALSISLGVAEMNAQMGKIVAAPTAGSCGVLPGVLISLIKNDKAGKDDIVKSMFTASSVGMVISNKAMIAGASGGCQAECGTASAMAAAACTEVLGGSPVMVGNAVAIALKSILGLVCDPVCGLVEVPCIKRNASSVTNGLMASQLALSKIESVIPVDDVIYAMREVGEALPKSLKETSRGGLAVTKTADMIAKKITL